MLSDPESIMEKVLEFLKATMESVIELHETSKT
jgi:hypothetical protein